MSSASGATPRGTPSPIYNIVGLVSSFFFKVKDAPFERMQLLFKTQNELIKQGRLSSKYESVIDCFYSVVPVEGFFSLWKGYPLMLFRSAYTTFIKNVLPIQYITNRLINQFDRNTDYWKWFFMKIFVGCVPGIVQLLLVYPLDVIRVLYMTDVVRLRADKALTAVPTRLFKGILDVIRQVYEKNGIAGFYYGLLPSLLGVIIYRVVYFSLAEITLLLHSDEKVSFSKMFWIQYTITHLSNLATYPLEVLRARLILQNCNPSGISAYTGLVDAIERIVNVEGFKSLYKGLTFNVVNSLMGVIVLNSFWSDREDLNK